MDPPLRSAPAPLSVAPSGTVTFLFSDIEGSTARWDRFPDTMADAVRRHDAIVRGSVALHDGFIFKTIGDAFCIAFAAPHDAVAAALTMQRALAAEDFSAVDGVRVRVGLHTGTAEERDGDYFGPTVNRVSRITAVGCGGQILLSAIAGELVRGALPDGVTLRELGEYRLKDLAAPERIFQLVAPDLADEFPPLRAPDVVQTNLPAMLSSFVGREAELESLRALLEKHRLVTIVGPGGVGKTRTSVRLADSLRSRFAEGIWFIDLAPLANPDLVVDQFASVLGVRNAGDRPTLESVASAIGRKRVLAIVDNCEHVIDAAATCMQRLLARCPELRIVATSRESLRISGERQFVLPPLSLPERIAPITAAVAMQHSAVVLLVDRATAANDAFALTDANAASVVEVCRHLDALPFALELAAPRLVMFTPKQLLERVGERFRMLRGTRAQGPERTRTLLSLIDWSHDLLSAEERALFRRLSVFAGSWTLDGAIAVGCGDGIDEDDVLDLLGSLVAKSMVVSEHESDNARFYFLESMHQYAHERLDAQGERAEIELRFAELVLSFTRRAAETLRSMRERTWLDDIEREIDNIREVLQSTLLGNGNAKVGAEIAAALGFFWHARRPKEGASWLEAARAIADACPTDLQASVFLESARVEVVSAQTVPFAKRAVELYRKIDDSDCLSRALEYLGQSFINSGRYSDAEICLTESIEQERANGEPSATARTRGLRGWARYFGRGDAEGATSDLQSALVDLEAKQRYRDASLALRGLAYISIGQGRFSDSAAQIGRALLICEDLEDARGTGILRFELAHALLLDGRATDARANAIEAIRLLSDAGMPPAMTFATIVMAAISEALGEVEEAAMLIGWSRAAIKGSESHFLPPGLHLLDETQAKLAARLDGEDLERAMARGAMLDARAIEHIVRREKGHESKIA